MKHTLADAIRAAHQVQPVLSGIRGVSLTLDPEQPFPVNVVIDNDVIPDRDLADIQDAIVAVLDEDRTDRQGSLMVGSVDRVPVLVTPTRWVLTAVPA